MTTYKPQLNNKVFVVGGTGMLGDSAIEHMVNNGYTITTICLPPVPTENKYGDKVKYVAKNIRELSDTEMLNLMKDHDYMLIAVGADERHTPKSPAIDFFRRYNVQDTRNLLRIARLAKVKKVVVMGSYFTHFNHKWPELELTKHHPYIKSRVEQMEVAFTFNTSAMSVAVLEIPYIFGTLPKRSPLMRIVNSQLNSHNHIYYPAGGTAMATAKEVAEAVLGAFLYAEGGRSYPVASVNLKWKDFLSYLIKLNGQEHKKMVAYSKRKTKREMKRKEKRDYKDGRQNGINRVQYLEFQCRNAFIDPAECMTHLKYEPDDLKEALKQTLEACNYKVDKKIDQKTASK